MSRARWQDKSLGYHGGKEEGKGLSFFLYSNLYSLSWSREERGMDSSCDAIISMVKKSRLLVVVVAMAGLLFLLHLLSHWHSGQMSTPPAFASSTHERRGHGPCW